MANFIKLQKLSGEKIIINADNYIFVENGQKNAVIVAEQGDYKATVTSSLDEIIRLLKDQGGYHG